MKRALLYNNLRAKWEGKIIVVSLVIPLIPLLTMREAFKTYERYPSVDSIHMIPIEIVLFLVVFVGVILAHWDQRDVLCTGQIVLTKPVSRWAFFMAEYAAGVIVISFIVVITGFLAGVVSFMYGHFSWKLILAFCCTVFSVLLLEAVMLLLSQLVSRSKALILGMAVCLGGLYRLQIEYVIKEILGISNISYLLPDLQFGLLSSMNIIHGYPPGDFLFISFATWMVDFAVVFMAAYFIFSRKDL